MLTVITDPGIDDLIALTLLQKLSPDNKSSLIASFGNVPLKYTEINAKEFISFVSPHWNYYKGSERPLEGKINIPWGESFHGSDGTWNIHPKNTSSEVNVLKRSPINKEVISLGPLTDLLKIQDKVSLSTVSIMGGAFSIEESGRKHAEYNIAADPESANIFFSKLNTTKVAVVPLDVTNKVNWPLKQIKDIPETGKINIWLKQLLLTWFRKYRNGHAESFELFDPLTVYLHFYSDKALWNESGVSIITKGKQRGRTIFSDKNYPCNIAMEIDNPTSVSEHIYNILFT